MENMCFFFFLGIGWNILLPPNKRGLVAAPYPDYIGLSGFVIKGVYFFGLFFVVLCTVRTLYV